MDNTNPDTSQAQDTPADNGHNDSAPNHTAPQADTPPNDNPNSVDALPEWAQKEIRSLREESAKYRTKSKDIEASKADELKAAQEQAEQERQAMIKEIGKKLGLVEDESQDPEALVKAAAEREQAAAKERDEMREKLTQYQRSDAMRKALENVDGKVDAELLNALLKSDNAYNEVDINADDFESQVAGIVQQKLESHPNLIQAIHKASGVDTSNTHKGGDKPLTREDLQGMSAHEINEAVKAGKLSHLMNT